MLEFLISSLTHELFRSVLIGSQIFGHFPIIFLLLTTNLILLWLYNIPGITELFKTY